MLKLEFKKPSNEGIQLYVKSFSIKIWCLLKMFSMSSWMKFSTNAYVNNLWIVFMYQVVTKIRKTSIGICLNFYFVSVLFYEHVYFKFKSRKNVLFAYYKLDLEMYNTNVTNNVFICKWNTVLITRQTVDVNLTDCS